MPLPSSPSTQPHHVAIRGRFIPTRWDRNIPPLLRPLVRAYLLGYAFSIGPRLLALILQHVRERGKGAVNETARQKPRVRFVEALKKNLREGLDWQRFPAFCAALVGGSTLLEPVLRKAFARILKGIPDTSSTRLSRWSSSFIAAWLSLQMLQSKQGNVPPFINTPASANPNPTSPTASQFPREPKAGRTLDLTLFAATRALDVIIGELWSQRRCHLPGLPSKTRKTLDRLASNLTDPLIFSLSSALVMWNWFYTPSALPRAYNRWISSAASVDQRLIVALQRCRDKTIRYGEDTGQAALLGEMCEDYRWPKEWGNPAVSIPFPCELVHMGAGTSCELHALSRFRRAWLWSMRTYIPIQFVVFLIRARTSKNLRRDLLRAFLSASRSSAFLGTFISLFYYGVCLSRTRLGPHILGTDVAARQRIDSGICVGTGCFLCGWSVLLEPSSRRNELALFVAPRAMATILPRKYDADKQWVERLAFAASTAIVFTCVLENKSRVRGVLGGVLRMVLAA